MTEKQELYLLVREILTQEEPVKIMDDKFGNFAYTPAGHALWDMDRLVHSHRHRFPTAAENDAMLITLNLFLRQFTRETGYVLTREISLNPFKKIGPFGASIFIWQMVSTAYLNDLKGEKALTAGWWLTNVNAMKDKDALILNPILRKKAEQDNWTQPKIL